MSHFLTLSRNKNIILFVLAPTSGKSIKQTKSSIDFVTRPLTASTFIGTASVVLSLCQLPRRKARWYIICKRPLTIWGTAIVRAVFTLRFVAQPRIRHAWPATCVRLRRPHRVSRSSVFFGGSGPFARRWCQGAEKQARPRSGSGRVLKRKTSASGVRPVSVRYGVRSPLPFIFALLFAVSAFVRPRRPFAFSVFFFFYSFRHPCVAKLILPFVPERARCEHVLKFILGKFLTTINNSDY